MAKKFTRVTQTESIDDRQRHDAVREQIKHEFPPKSLSENGTQCIDSESADGIGYQIRKARTAQGLTWYAVAKKAGIPSSGTVRAIEEGKDAKLSSVQAIVAVLGLRLTAEAASQ